MLGFFEPKNNSDQQSKTHLNKPYKVKRKDNIFFPLLIFKLKVNIWIEREEKNKRKVRIAYVNKCVR